MKEGYREVFLALNGQRRAPSFELVQSRWYHLSSSDEIQSRHRPIEVDDYRLIPDNIDDYFTVKYLRRPMVGVVFPSEN
jgi:hypothetical protein